MFIGKVRPIKLLMINYDETRHSLIVERNMITKPANIGILYPILNKKTRRRRLKIKIHAISRSFNLKI